MNRRAQVALAIGLGVFFVMSIDARDLTGGKGGKGGTPTRKRPVIVPGTGKGGPTGTNPDADAMARTIWGEAAGEGRKGMELVAAVIVNRVRAQTFYGRTIQEVIFKPFQFEIWNAGNTRGAASRAVTTSDTAFRAAQEIAGQAVAGQLRENAQGATHYHTRQVNPSWSRSPQMRFLFDHGNHRFYREILTA